MQPGQTDYSQIIVISSILDKRIFLCNGHKQGNCKPGKILDCIIHTYLATCKTFHKMVIHNKYANTSTAKANYITLFKISNYHATAIMTGYNRCYINLRIHTHDVYINGNGDFHQIQ